MDSLKISVVVPTYKRPHLLMRCMAALLRQTFPAESYEIVIVSDGEDNDTMQSVETLHRQKFPIIRFYSLPAKRGPAAARNLGWILAQGQLVVFTDDDCVPAEAWLAAMWDAHRSSHRAEIAFSGATMVPIGQVPTDYEKNISQLASAEFITANCACTRRALQRVGGFDERFKMAWREDSDLQFKFILHNIPIIKVRNAVVTHPVRKAPWGVSIREERKGMFNALLYKKYPRLYKERIEPSPPWHYYTITVFLMLLLVGIISDKPIPKVAGLTGWVAMTSWFAARRLRTTSHSWNHVSEMIFTSAIIPTLSLFWKVYGSLKFRKLLIP